MTTQEGMHNAKLRSARPLHVDPLCWCSLSSPATICFHDWHPDAVTESKKQISERVDQSQEPNCRIQESLRANPERQPRARENTPSPYQNRPRAFTSSSQPSSRHRKPNELTSFEIKLQSVSQWNADKNRQPLSATCGSNGLQRAMFLSLCVGNLVQLYGIVQRLLLRLRLGPNRGIVRFPMLPKTNVPCHFNSLQLFARAGKVQLYITRLLPHTHTHISWSTLRVEQEKDSNPPSRQLQCRP